MRVKAASGYEGRLLPFLIVDIEGFLLDRFSYIRVVAIHELSLGQDIYRSIDSVEYRELPSGPVESDILAALDPVVQPYREVAMSCSYCFSKLAR